MAEQNDETGFSDSGIPLDFRVAGKQKHAVFSELAGYMQARLQGSDLSPERRQELQAKVAHLTASADRWRKYAESAAAAKAEAGGIPGTEPAADAGT